MSIKVSKIKPLKKVALLAVLLTLLGGEAAAQLAGRYCHVVLETDPPTPSTISESETLSVIVRVHYIGYSSTVRITAKNLPPFASGLSDNHSVCGDCTVADTIYFHPGFCDSGKYFFKFIGTSDYGGGLKDEIVYYLKVLNTDRPCELNVKDHFIVTAGEELSFDVALTDPDSGCEGEPPPQWSFDGYPFDHGAELGPGDYNRTFTWLPTDADTGIHEANFEVSVASSVCRARVTIEVQPELPSCVYGPPIIMQEPQFSPGTSNEICFIPNCEAYEHQVCYFDSLFPDEIMGCRLPSPGRSQAGPSANCVVIEDLEDGHTYGYFAAAYYIEWPDSFERSESVTYSTQDATPPNSVDRITALADSGGVLVVNWYGVTDTVSYVESYEIYRKPGGGEYSLITVLNPIAGNDEYTLYQYRDSLGSGTGLVEGQPYHFKVTAVDVVGNRGGGSETGAVAPDSTAPCRPQIEIPYDYRYLFTSYLRGTESLVRGKSDCQGIAAADSIRFESVRDSLKYFPVHWAPLYNFFESAWIPCGLDWVEHVFDLLPPSGDSSYVNGHRYFFRIQAKDAVGNISEWSRIDSVYMDVYPPDDISNLTVTLSLDTATAAYSMDIRWDVALDNVSGLKSYDVYRSVGDSGFDTILASVDEPHYTDRCEDLDLRDVLCYRVGSRDNVGNVRDWSETNWEVCERVPAAPEIWLACDTLLSGEVQTEGNTDTELQCYVGGDMVTVWWTGYDNTGVDYYVVQRNDALFHQHDPGADHLGVPLPEEGLYTIAARAVFTSGLVSPWSNTATVIKDQTPPDPVEWLSVVNDHESCTGFFLTWEEPYDDTGVGWYRVSRWITGEDPIPAGTASSTSFCDDCDNGFTAYEFYNYKVEPVDVLGNVQTDYIAVDSEYCNCSPIVDGCPQDISEQCITFSWARVQPSLSEEVIFAVRVYKDQDVNPVLVAEDTVRNTWYPFYPLPFGAGYYTFQVKEIPQDLPDSRVSAWSKPCTVPFECPLPVIADLGLQPQPVLPEETSSSEGLISLHWTYRCLPGLEGFEITRACNGSWEATLDVPARCPDTTYEWDDSGLSDGCEYTYCIRAKDRFGQTSPDTCASASFDPPWVFTPRISEFDMRGYFKGDSLLLSWEWVDGSGAPVGNIYGAHMVQVQVSSESSFGSQSNTTGWKEAEGEPGPVYIRNLIDPSSKTVYCRLRARDSWDGGREKYVSPWSTEYFGTPCAVHDDIPPDPVSGLSISARADSSNRPGLIDVYLDWAPANDGTGGVGLDCYRVYRDSSSTGWVRLADCIRTTCWIHQDLIVSIEDSDDYSYTVRPVDSLGNEQMYGNDIAVLELLKAPTDLTAHDKRRITWNYQGPVDSFYVECSYDKKYLGTQWMQFHPLEARAYVPAESLGYTFETDDDFTKHDTIYFHVKSTWYTFESPWSEVASYPPEEGRLTEEESAGLPPERFELFQNYPNPFNPTTRISFSTPVSGRVLLRIFNVNGQVVKTLMDREVPPGTYSVEWDGTNDWRELVSSGIYFYQIKAEGFVSSKKIVLLR